MSTPAAAAAVVLRRCSPAHGAPAAHAQSPDASDWGYYGGDIFGQRFSSLDQINRDNVAQLHVAWSYRTGELGAGFARASKLTFEATPVLAFGLLYLETATNIVIALDPETGAQRWRFDPHIDRSRHYAEATSRGVSVWEDPTRARTGAVPAPRVHRHARCAPAGAGRRHRPAVRRLRHRRRGRSHARHATSAIAATTS